MIYAALRAVIVGVCLVPVILFVAVFHG